MTFADGLEKALAFYDKLLPGALVELPRVIDRPLLGIEAIGLMLEDITERLERIEQRMTPPPPPNDEGE
jgi:hypothetical protein